MTPSTTLGFSLGAVTTPTRALVERFWAWRGGGRYSDDDGGVVEEAPAKAVASDFGGGDSGGDRYSSGRWLVVLSKGAFGGGGGVIEGALALARRWRSCGRCSTGRRLIGDEEVVDLAAALVHPLLLFGSSSPSRQSPLPSPTPPPPTVSNSHALDRRPPPLPPPRARPGRPPLHPDPPPSPTLVHPKSAARRSTVSNSLTGPTVSNSHTLDRRPPPLPPPHAPTADRLSTPDPPPSPTLVHPKSRLWRSTVSNSSPPTVSNSHALDRRPPPLPPPTRSTADRLSTPRSSPISNSLTATAAPPPPSPTPHRSGNHHPKLVCFSRLGAIALAGVAAGFTQQGMFKML
ncbi:hypothetical protein Scep_006745 [Stephania cephalantha]|uniref:Uncharacterized protein n=1 Tax=Stephania cephalantha TaxID=152367 RepID=A0AAP0K8G0_9MAGN